MTRATQFSTVPDRPGRAVRRPMNSPASTKTLIATSVSECSALERRARLPDADAIQNFNSTSRPLITIVRNTVRSLRSIATGLLAKCPASDHQQVRSAGCGFLQSLASRIHGASRSGANWRAQPVSTDAPVWQNLPDVKNQSRDLLQCDSLPLLLLRALAARNCIRQFQSKSGKIRWPRIILSAVKRCRRRAGRQYPVAILRRGCPWIGSCRRRFLPAK